GVEHAILHLLYSRFIVKVLHDMGLIDFDEPFKNLFTQGMIIKDGAKMSKSKGNVVSPDELIKRYGADTIRLYTLFIGPPEKDAEWSDRGVEGAYRFLGRVWRMIERVIDEARLRPPSAVMTRSPSGEAAGLSAKPMAGTDDGQRASSEDKNLKRKTHQTIKKVTDDIEKGFHFNTAISSTMELVNEIYAVIDKKNVSPEILSEAAEAVIVLLSPFVPHIAEELWQKLGKTTGLLKECWPSFDKSLIINEIITVPVQVNGRLRSKVEITVGADEAALKEKVLSDGKIKSYLEDFEVVRWVIIPDKLVNIVVKKK
ncbi:MAG: class I tRNA ligase family protein, partial [Candidatus Omnitrophica bacterium]|nr:class I tRNA ligase family protein [Candidatus Omnitrophota bacterium]